MKKIVLSAVFAFALFSATNVMAQQGFGTNQPDKSAVVDIVSTKRGLLIPRISIPDLNAAAPVSAPATSLFVYNTNTGTGEGFYYWDGAKWVRFVSGNTEKTTIVAPGENVKVEDVVSGNTTTYTVGIEGGTADGQVLVTEIVGAVTTTKWVDPNTFVTEALTAGNAIGIAPDPNDPTKVEVKFNGTLTEDTTIATGAHDLAITGLEDITTTFDPVTHNIVVMGTDGVLKITSPKSLIEEVIEEGNLEAKTLTGEGITVTAGTVAGTTSSVADALLADVTLGIADGAITNTKLANGAVSQDKMTSFTAGNGTSAPAAAGQVPVADGSGNVAYQDVATAIGEDLTTDGKIVIGNNTSTVTSLTDAVLVATELSIATESITSAEIKNGTIQTEDIKAPGTVTESSTGGTPNQVMVTNTSGDVAWINQSDLANKDTYTGVDAIDITANGTSATGGTNYDVTVATATGTTLGVVKEAATTPTVNINATGELSVNLDNIVLSGDVTGPLNDTNVAAIQGTPVAATAPTATNDILKFDGTQWTPSELTGADVTGAALTSTSLTIPANTAVLTALNIEVAPGTDGQILTTVDNAGSLETQWASLNSLVEVDNGLNKDNADVVELGGALIRPTTITTSAANTLAIAELQKAPEAPANKAVVAEDGSGILRTVEKVLTGTNVNIASNAGYSFHTPEVVVNVTLAGADQTITFPSAASAPGQVINIKIANTDDSHTGFLNVLDTYGAMPYQGWIVKSNGTAWVIVGRN